MVSGIWSCICGDIYSTVSTKGKFREFRSMIVISSQIETLHLINPVACCIASIVCSEMAIVWVDIVGLNIDSSCTTILVCSPSTMDEIFSSEMIIVSVINGYPSSSPSPSICSTCNVESTESS